MDARLHIRHIASPEIGLDRSTAPSSWIALAVAHPNRATEIIPLISGNCAR